MTPVPTEFLHAQKDAERFYANWFYATGEDFFELALAT